MLIQKKDFNKMDKFLKRKIEALNLRLATLEDIQPGQMVFYHNDESESHGVLIPFLIVKVLNSLGKYEDDDGCVGHFLNRDLWVLKTSEINYELSHRVDELSAAVEAFSKNVSTHNTHVVARLFKEVRKMAAQYEIDAVQPGSSRRLEYNDSKGKIEPMEETKLSADVEELKSEINKTAYIPPFPMTIKPLLSGILKKAKAFEKAISDSGRYAGYEPTERPESQINHPSHYGGDTIYEAIKVIEAWGAGFNVGNALKYLSRAGKKDPEKTVEDLLKAAWYLDREIKNLTD